MSLDVDFAILAPVPMAHLQSGKGVAAKEGFVAFRIDEMGVLPAGG